MNSPEQTPDPETRPRTDSAPPPEKPRAQRSSFFTWLFIVALVAAAVWWLVDYSTDRGPDRTAGPVTGPADDDARRERNRKAENQYQLGVIAAEQGQADQAMLLFAEAAQINPTHPQANLSLGILLREQGHHQEALERLRRALQANPDEPQTHYYLGLCHGDMLELDQAIEEYGLAVQGAPRFVPARYNLGASLMLLGRTDEAIETFEETLKIIAEMAPSDLKKSSRAATLKGLADALIRRGKLDEAGARLEEALSENPELGSAYALRAEIALARQRTDQARADLNRALELNPNDARTKELLAALDPELGVARGEAESLTDRLSEDAIAGLEEAVRLDPQNADKRNDLGQALSRSGRHSQARRHFEEAVRLAPTDFRGCFNLASVFQLQGEPAQAAHYYRRTLELNSAYLEARRCLVTVLRAEGKWMEALAAAGEGLELAPEDPALLRQLAWMLATCSEQQVRDGRRALSAALLLKELWEQAGSPPGRGSRVLDVLAAAYAENAQFEAAASAAQWAARLAREGGKERQAQRIETRLQLYRQGHPFHSEP